jgi:hypothetical protein
MNSCTAALRKRYGYASPNPVEEVSTFLNV